MELKQIKEIIEMYNYYKDGFHRLSNVSLSVSDVCVDDEVVYFVEEIVYYDDNRSERFNDSVAIEHIDTMKEWLEERGLMPNENI